MGPVACRRELVTSSLTSSTVMSARPSRPQARSGAADGRGGRCARRPGSAGKVHSAQSPSVSITPITSQASSTPMSGFVGLMGTYPIFSGSTAREGALWHERRRARPTPPSALPARTASGAGHRRRADPYEREAWRSPRRASLGVPPGRPGPASPRPRSPPGPSQRSSSWSSQGPGSAEPETQPGRPHLQDVGAARAATPPGSRSSGSASTPSSSRSSRTSAASGDSPGSTLPPGSSQRPASSGGALRRAAAGGRRLTGRPPPPRSVPSCAGAYGRPALAQVGCAYSVCVGRLPGPIRSTQ